MTQRTDAPPRKPSAPRLTAVPARPGDSDPDADEAYRRVRKTARALRAGLAEYREYVASAAA